VPCGGAWTVRPDLTGQVALITGGTRGLGNAIARAFARCGAATVVTHRWGSVAESEVGERFAAEGLTPPLVVEADVANADELERLLDRVAEAHGRVDLFVSNVCVTARGDGFDGLRRRDLLQSLERSAWPLLTHLDAIERRFGAMPRVTIAMSSDGPDHFYPGYHYVAMSKAALEALVAAVAPRVAAAGGRIYGLRTRQVDTQSFHDVFPPEVRDVLMLSRLRFFVVEPEQMGDAAVALASGSLAGLHGDVLCADKGAAFFDNFIAVAPLLQPGSPVPEAVPAATNDASLVMSLFDDEPDSPQAGAAEAFRLVEAMRTFREERHALPRHVVALEPRGLSSATSSSAAGRAVLETVVRYVTSDLMFAPVSVNVVRHEPTSIGRTRAADTARVLCSGLLDHVRGQTLELHDR